MTRPSQQARLRELGLTVVELLIIMALIASVAALTLPRFGRALEQARMERAVLDIAMIQFDVRRYFEDNGFFPASLDDLPRRVLPDPWGNPYQYLSLTDVKGKGKARKDRFLVPLNTDFDLYSMGPDGESVSPLTAKASRDDIVRANNGGFIGPASEF
jgi:general secretion pathway protein G